MAQRNEGLRSHKRRLFRGGTEDGADTEGEISPVRLIGLEEDSNKSGCDEDTGHDYKPAEKVVPDTPKNSFTTFNTSQ